MITVYSHRVDALKPLETALKETLLPNLTSLHITFSWHMHQPSRDTAKIIRRNKREGLVFFLISFGSSLLRVVKQTMTLLKEQETMQDIVKERLPKFTEEEVKMVKGSTDFVGVNQYTTYFMSDPHLTTKPKDLGYQQDWNVAFNCMDDPGDITVAQGVNDTTRIKYYRDYLTQLKKAVDDGAGYFAWSLLDNFEWLSGYTSRFGIVYVDYKDLKRYPKMSALWFIRLLKRDQ